METHEEIPQTEFVCRAQRGSDRPGSLPCYRFMFLGRLSHRCNAGVSIKSSGKRCSYVIHSRLYSFCSYADTVKIDGFSWNYYEAEGRNGGDRAALAVTYQ